MASTISVDQTAVNPTDTTGIITEPVTSHSFNNEGDNMSSTITEQLSISTDAISKEEKKSKRRRFWQYFTNLEFLPYRKRSRETETIRQDQAETEAREQATQTNEQEDEATRLKLDRENEPALSTNESPVQSSGPKLLSEPERKVNEHNNIPLSGGRYMNLSTASAYMERGQPPPRP